MPWTHFRPTPEQISETCEQIRALWDEATHRQRWVHPLFDRWAPPKVKSTVLTEDEWSRSVWIASSYSGDY